MWWWWASKTVLKTTLVVRDTLVSRSRAIYMCCRTQQQGAPLEATPFALLLDANFVFGSPSSRQAAARLDPLRAGGSICPSADAVPPAWCCCRIQQEVEGLDLLLGSTFCWVRTVRAVVGLWCP